MLVEGFLDHLQPFFIPCLGDVTIAIGGKYIVKLAFERILGFYW